MNEISKTDRLRGLVACLDSVTAEANGDVAKYGEWQCDFAPHLRSYRKQIDDLLGIKDPEYGPQGKPS